MRRAHRSVASAHARPCPPFICPLPSSPQVRFYDMSFRLEAWFEDLEAGPVTSVSFASALNGASQTRADGTRLDFATPDFVCGTRRGYVVHLESALFEEVSDRTIRHCRCSGKGVQMTMVGDYCVPYRAKLLVPSCFVSPV